MLLDILVRKHLKSWINSQTTVSIWSISILNLKDHKFSYSSYQPMPHQPIFLLPPSESKKIWWKSISEQCSFNFSKPLELAIQATPKDLKCTWTRYEEWIWFNKSINQWPWIEAMARYSGVMFKAIDYVSLNAQQQSYFDKSVLILSGMYGLLKPTDQIANYKLPISIKGLLTFWWTQLTQALNILPKTQIIDLLPWSYKKMIQWSELNHEVMHVDFFQNGKKLTHAVKWVKWRWLHTQIQQWIENLETGIYEYHDEKWIISVVIS